MKDKNEIKSKDSANGEIWPVEYKIKISSAIKNLNCIYSYGHDIIKLHFVPNKLILRLDMYRIKIVITCKKKYFKRSPASM